jgi:hypothetical protein
MATKKHEEARRKHGIFVQFRAFLWLRISGDWVCWRAGFRVLGAKTR